MSVYVDAAIHSWRGQKWCHLIADNEEELHEFAIEKLGMKREWFQIKPRSIDHYDITAVKRELAIKLGAIAIGRVEICRRISFSRKQKLGLALSTN